MRGGFELGTIEYELGVKKSLRRNGKPTLRVAPEASTDWKEDQYVEELMDKPRRVTYSVEFSIDKSKDKYRKKG